MGPEYSAWPRWGNEFISLMTVGFPNPCHVNTTPVSWSVLQKHVRQHSATGEYISAITAQWEFTQIQTCMTGYIKSKMQIYFQFADCITIVRWLLCNPGQKCMWVTWITSFIRRYQANLTVIIVQIFRPCYKLDYNDTPSPNNLYSTSILLLPAPCRKNQLHCASYT